MSASSAIILTDGGIILPVLGRQMARIAITPELLAALAGQGLRTIERLIAAGKLPKPDNGYPREWGSPESIQALVDKLHQLSEPSMRSAAASIELLVKRNVPARESAG